MKVIGKMSDDKKDDSPEVVITEVDTSSEKLSKTKKYVIISVGVILTAVVILTGILVGMYMFTEAEKEIVKYTIQLNKNTKQDVTSDPNENIVQFHTSTPSQETWIVNDFGRDIQLMKIKSDDKTNCFITPLNRTNMLPPSMITGPESNDVKNTHFLTYGASDTPVTDTSFLGKTARETCKGISIYWLYPHCNNDDDKYSNNTGLDHQKTKRQTTIDYSPYYIRTWLYYYYSGNYYWIPCYTGCCRKVCAWLIYYFSYISGGRMYCYWIPYGTISDSCAVGPRGISCPDC